LLKKAIIAINHDGCWTENTKGSVKTINLEVYPEKGYLRSWVITSDLEVKKLMRGGGVKRINGVYKSRRGTVVDFLNVYKGSVAGLLYSKEVLLLNNYNLGGNEVWSFVVGRGAISELRKELSSMGKISNIEVQDFEPCFPILTDMEKKVLRTAIDMGYLDYPRERHAEELAERLKVSKVTFLYHWRNLQRKIMDYFARELIW
jgi:predicted DNA binding protein